MHIIGVENAISKRLLFSTNTCPHAHAQITEKDAPILQHLIDIQEEERETEIEGEEAPPGYRLVFTFSPNDYLTNTTLVRIFSLKHLNALGEAIAAGCLPAWANVFAGVHFWLNVCGTAPACSPICFLAHCVCMHAYAQPRTPACAQSRMDGITQPCLPAWALLLL